MSSGTDPNKDLLQLADELSMGDKLKSIALGQGQGKQPVAPTDLSCLWWGSWRRRSCSLYGTGKLAARLVESGLVKGDWVLLQNCHLSISWMPDLEKIVEDFEPDKIHKDFRLW